MDIAIWLNDVYQCLCTHTHTSLVPLVKPSDLNVTSKNSTSVNISWKPIPIEEQNGFIIGYTVIVKGSNSDSPKPILVEGADADSIGVRNLHLSTSYTFEVCAKTSKGSGPAAIFPSEGGETITIKVTGESSIEIFTTKNEVVYVSPTVHVSNKLTRTKYIY